MTSPYAFGTKSDANAALQQALTAHGFDTKGADGIFGRNTRDAVEAAQQYFSIAPADGVPRADLLAFLGLTAPAPLPKPSIFDQIGTLVSIINLLKGKTMTSDQLTGVLRALIAALSGYFIAKGWGTADFWTWIGAGVTGVVPIVWTWINNRPKTIVPIAAK